MRLVIEDMPTETTLKINGQPVAIAWEKVHPSWLPTILEYGARRYPNDKFSGEKGNDKLEMVRELVASFADEMPERVRGSSGAGKSVDPVVAMMLKNAKADLTVLFKAATEEKKIEAMVADARVAKYFDKSESAVNGYVWNDDAVLAWVDAQKEKGKADYRGDAEKAVAKLAEMASDF